MRAGAGGVARGWVVTLPVDDEAAQPSVCIPPALVPLVAHARERGVEAQVLALHLLPEEVQTRLLLHQCMFHL